MNICRKNNIMVFSIVMAIITQACVAEIAVYNEDVTRLLPVAIESLCQDGKPQYTCIHIKKIFDLEQTTNKSVQSIAIYRDELFAFHDCNDVIDIYDLNQYSLKQSLSLVPKNTTHCNVATFRHYFNNSESRYPLLYLTERGILHRLLVFRFEETDGGLTAKNLQTINIGTDTTALAYVDPDSDKLYLHYYLKGQPTIRFLSKFDVPNVEDSIYTIPFAEAQETVLMKRSAMQDATIYRGVLFMLQGYANTGQLHFYNLKEHIDFLLMNLPEFGLTSEPEGIAVYDNSLIVSFYDRSVYKLTFYDDSYSLGKVASNTVNSFNYYDITSRNIISDGHIYDNNGVCLY